MLTNKNKLNNHTVLKNKLIVKSALIFIGFCAMLSQTSCKSGKKEKEEKTQFLVTSTLRTDTSIVKEYVCQIRSIRHIELRALEKGYLQNIYIDEGQFVKEG